MTAYRICSRCVMDTSDPDITFDAEGICNHCHSYDQAVAQSVFRGAEGERRLKEIVGRIKREGEGKRYDCLIGLSGGVDSSYVALLVKNLGLRPLAVHLDNGWNSEISVRNIENIIKRLGFDLYTEVLHWQEFRRLQLAFLRASTPDSEVPTDHAIVATLYRVARRHRIRWIIDGSNIVTEVMVPAAWSHGHGDWKYIRSVNARFGGVPLKTFPHYSLFDARIRLPKIDRVERLMILNYVDYDKPAAMEAIRRELGWEYYGGKHYESIYTRFYQGYILKEKFGFDKRRSHLSCLVAGNVLTRLQALAELKEPAIDPGQLREDRAFVIKKLGITEQEFQSILDAAPRRFWDFPSYELDLASPSPLRGAYWVVQIDQLLALFTRLRVLTWLALRDPVAFARRVLARMGRSLR